MKISVTKTNNGIKREIDFQGAKLPNGLSIEDTLKENEKLKSDISHLEKEVEDKSSIFAKIIPWKPSRDILEILMFVLGIIGIVVLFI